MRGDINVIYNIPKDIAFRYIKMHIYKNSVKFAAYKTCLDMYVTKKTIWNAMTRLSTDGIFVIMCNYHNISHVLDFLDSENLSYDVLLFYGDNIKGQDFFQTYSSIIPFIIIYKSNSYAKIKSSNVIKIKSDNFFLDIFYFFCRFIDPKEISLYIGEISNLAVFARRIGHELIVFDNDLININSLLEEGMIESEVDPWETIK